MGTARERRAWRRGASCRNRSPLSPQEMERLRERLEAKEKEAQQLQSRPEAPQDEVALLRRRVAEKERARAASDTLCRSLTEETRQLRRTLAATAHMCQHLAGCLEARQGAPGEQRPEVGARGEGSTGWGGERWTGRPGRLRSPRQSPPSGLPSELMGRKIN